MTCSSETLAQAKTFTQELHRALSDERHFIVLTLRLLADVDAKRLYADMGYSSMYAFCTQELGLSEQQSYLRINVARTARRHPQVFDKLELGELHMSGVHRLSPALYVVEEPDSLIDEATNLSKRETEELVARYMPRPDQPTRSDPIPNQPGRYLLSANISATAMALINKARDLGGSQDISALIEDALGTHVEMLLKRKLRATSVPGRRVSTKVKRPAWERDQGQCTFHGPNGERCTETRNLQFDHVNPVALGGRAETPDDIRLLCPAHNRLMARRMLGPEEVTLYEQGFRPRRTTRSSE